MHYFRNGCPLESRRDLSYLCLENPSPKYRRPISTILLTVFLSGCAARAVVPSDPRLDHAPLVDINATSVINGVHTDVEPGKETVASNATVKVTRGGTVIFVSNASNPGGVKSITLTGSKNGSQIFQGSVVSTIDSSGKAETSLSVLNASSAPGAGMEATIDAPVTLIAVGTNFNGMSTSITVTYVPTDFAVAIAIEPATIGYGNPSSATLSWSALYGKPPYAISLNPGVGVSPVLSLGSTTVSPGATTNYLFTVKDQTQSITRNVLLTVIPAPLPPSISMFDATPDHGYAKPGTTDHIIWHVDDCTPPACNVILTGQGTGYASAEHVVLSHLAADGGTPGIPYVPHDTTNFQLNASSPAGVAKQKTLQLVLDTSGGAGPSAGLTTYYFTILDNNPNPTWTCSTTSVPADNVTDAEKLALSQYGSGYSIGIQLTAAQFNAGNGCSI
jgi:hypothetical protein